MCLLVEELLVLVSWPDENDALSVASSRQIGEPLVEGDICAVSERRNSWPECTPPVYTVHVHAHTTVSMCAYNTAGTRKHMNKLLDDFL